MTKSGVMNREIVGQGFSPADQASLKACPTKMNKGGFTLIETIITLVVLSIAAVGVLSVFTTGIKGSASPSLVGQATQLAQEKMDMIIGDRMNTARGFNYIIPGNYAAENPITGFAGFNRSVAIICVNAGTLNADNGAPPPCASGYTHVTVTVSNTTIGTVTVDGLVTNY
jgi:prepilin-type N-terminal cleavage/methylation domain-containing protein